MPVAKDGSAFLTHARNRHRATKAIMKTTALVLAIGLATIGTAAVTAQSQGTKTTTTTKTEIKNGKDLTVTGCLEKGTGTDYVLNVTRQNGNKEPSRYSLITKEDLSAHVGHRVEVHGKAVTDGHGTVSVESKVKTEVGNTAAQETKTKTEGTSGVLETAFLSVTTIEPRSSSCN